MLEPRFTVITPCHHRAPFIEQTLCSVLDQGYGNLEYIVIDAGSTDSASSIIECYADDLAAHIREPFDRIVDGINKALAISTGDLVAILGSDGLYLPGALDAVAQAWSRLHRPRWLIGHAMRIGTEGQTLGRIPAGAPHSLSSFLMHNGGHWSMSASFWSRKMVDTAGPLHRGFEFGFDYEYWCRLLAAGIEPQIVPRQFLSALRQQDTENRGAETLKRGLEMIAVAARYAKHLPLRQRCELWCNCDLRRRIYALAEAELHEGHATLNLLKHFVRHPWWFADDAFRRTLLHGVAHPVPAGMLDRAA